MKERCLTCLTWHEPDQHLDKPADPPEILTGQVPVSGNPCDERDYDDS